jgi:hypothetical protein
MKNKRFCLLTAILLMIALAHGSLCASNSVWTFIPASSFGSFTIGQDFHDILKALGEPDMKKDVQDARLMKYEKRGIIMQVNNGTNRVQFIGSDKQGFQGISYKTAEGITVGSPRSLVEKHYSSPTSIVPVRTREFYPRSVEMAIYAGRGISFHYDSTNNVAAIIVFDPKLFGRS